MNSRKIALSIIGAILIIASFFGAKYIINSKTTPKPRPEKVVKTVIVETVKNGNVPIIVPANGNLVAKRRVELYAEVQGVFKSGNKLFK
ncbi:MAG: efflux transporter periplasmic adaptor subunit, partial [Arenibacter sp.]